MEHSKPTTVGSASENENDGVFPFEGLAGAKPIDGAAGGTESCA
jgi:hypothetical protein